MTTADWVLLIFLALATLGGWRMGTLRVIAHIGSYVAAYYVARAVSAPLTAFVGQRLPVLTGGGSEQLNAILSLFFDPQVASHKILATLVFIAVFIIVCIAVRWVARLLTSAFDDGFLGKVNRLLGAFLTLCLSIGVVVILANVIAPMLASLGAEGLSRGFANSQYIWPFLSSLPSIL